MHGSDGFGLSMSLKNSQRRDQRRRLVVAWNRTTTGSAAAQPAAPRLMAEYAPEAHPERQRGPATLLPTGIGRLTLAILALVVPTAAAVVLGSWEPAGGRPIYPTEGRFARSMAMLETCFDPHGATSLQAWLAQFNLLLAASVALIVRLMRRHRRDDYEGRYRAWGWLAGLFLITACAGVVPLGRLVGTAVTDATGIALGPDGLGWWFAVAAVAYAGASLWAVLPLHERAGTAVWLVITLSAWAGSAACTWLAGGPGLHGILARGLWSLAAACAAVTMLTAARSVIREVRGIPGRAPAAAEDRAAEKTVTVEDFMSEEEAPDFTPASADASADDTDFVDGSEQEHRHLSKAERKRLKKLARMKAAA